MPKKRSVQQGFSKQLQRVYARAMQATKAAPTSIAAAASNTVQGFSQAAVDKLIAADQKRQRRALRKQSQNLRDGYTADQTSPSGNRGSTEPAV